MDNNKNIVEILLTVFTVIKGEVKVLLIRKKEDPYKGYWQLPNAVVNSDEKVEDSIRKSLSKETGLPVISYQLCNIFSELDRKIDQRIIGINYICYIDAKTIEMKQTAHSIEDVNWFSINKLPKLAFDYDEVLDKSLNNLKELILKVDVLKHFFPSDFTFPELQNACEIVLNKEMDRRNFRKYFIKNDLVELTGDHTEGTSGRPAKLYRFKEQVDTLDFM